MRPEGIYIDANLFVLLIVGVAGKHLIAKHRRLQKFQVSDYERMERLFNKAKRVLVTTNVLTEASNLLAQHGEPERSRIFDVFRILIDRTEEIFIASKNAGANSEFRRLGLTDAALLEVISKAYPLVTVDLELYLAATAKDKLAAYNFWHYQSW
ncbi:MAG: PIN domain-containing protein [Gammaproteobacteria bacterium]|nr:PIN domain-containing protein [Gammaproteobacteria bacterium]